MPARIKVSRRASKPASKKRKQRAAKARVRVYAQVQSFMGTPQANEVRIVTSGGTHAIGLFAWGKPRDLTPVGRLRAADLALEILKCTLGDPTEALRLHKRFQHRVISGMNPSAPWQITRAEVLQHVQAIRETEHDRTLTEEARRVAREPAPVAHEGGRGVGGGMIRFKQQETFGVQFTDEDEQ